MQFELDTFHRQEDTLSNAGTQYKHHVVKNKQRKK